MNKDGSLSLGKRLFAPFPRIFVVVLLVLWAPCALAALGNGKLQIHHVDVGQGDGALIISPLGQTVLVDDGTYTNCSAFVNYVKGLGITSIDYHFASHYHSDHIGCLDDLLASSVVLNIAGYDRGYSYTTTMYTAYVNALGSKRQTMAKNQVVTLDAGSANPVYIKCVDLNGAGVYSVTGSDENPKTMVLKITYGNFDEVMGGDLTGSPAVEATVGPEVGDVEVYKVHHHASATSSYDAWLNATTPEVAVISVGDGNSYGHPTSAVLTRLHNHSVKTYWTETGAGVSPVSGWDKVGGTIIIQASPQPGAAYTVTGNGFVDTYHNNGQADTTPPQVTVVKPNGGEIFYAGSIDTIRWVATDGIGVDSVSIYYSVDDGDSFPYTIVTRQQNDSSYVWTIPDTPSDSCVVKIVAYDTSLNSGEAVSDSPFSIASHVGAEAVPELARFDLVQNYPNPFNPVTRIDFSLNERARVSMMIYDISGKLIRTLVNETASAGTHYATWNGEDESGRAVASGIYVCKLETSLGKTTARKMVLLK
ncbi:MAG: T9SS type A sorting domain-containing protein [Candidatus Eisenbacteria bacterium]|nr:T9SS type A sorting domain-containing protein [Candidatus Eisenbacteria bacterium]